MSSYVDFNDKSASTLVIVVPLATCMLYPFRHALSIQILTALLANAAIFFGLGICYVAKSMRMRSRARRIQEAIVGGLEADGGAFASAQEKPRMWDITLINTGCYDKQSLEGMLVCS